MNLPVKIAAIAASLFAGALLLVLRARVALPADPGDDGFAPAKKRRRLFMALGVFLLWLACGLLLGLFHEGEASLQVNVFAPRMTLWGISFSSSVVIGWVATLAVLLVVVPIRIFVIPKFSEKPRGIQLMLETAIDALAKYTKEKAGFSNENLNAYMLTVALYLIGSAVCELFGLRPPTADLIMTLSLALIAFVLINYYGIRHKGVGGRIKSFAQPTAIVFPFKVLSDIATPVSLACRLYGNILGGMIVMHLVYMALGAFGVGVPAVLGLYFNAFHPLIQVFIFITLSLTFIGEAAE